MTNTTRPAEEEGGTTMADAFAAIEYWQDKAHTARKLLKEALSRLRAHDAAPGLRKDIARFLDAVGAVTPADAARLDWLRENTCDLRCVEVPIPLSSDADIQWVVIEHHMGKPHEREIGRSYSDDPREAIDAARAAQAQGGK